ncbi:DUF5615 family PIN-like protein [Leptolyngbya sp. CCNP1308]|uniref:DUF5615 family PIN-like protein n=1 Tax=Leptolyngbya sp. CCNP1308 TaxID=3110255 RepID=UPI003A59864F
MTVTSTLVEQGLVSTPDENLIEVCRRERCCLVSLDLDFSNPPRIEMRSPSPTGGIRCAKTLVPQ